MKYLVIVDPQGDFLDDGNLPVKGSFDKMCNLSAYLGSIPYDTYDHIFVTLDWHPRNHCSFTENGGQWPTHCVAFTPGALPFSPIQYHLLEWQQQGKVTYFTKGADANVEEYTAFDNADNLKKISTKIANDVLVKNANTDDVQIDFAGIVGTVCVQNTINSLKPLNVKLNALLNYIAQFSAADEGKFIVWCNENNVNCL